MQSIAASAFAPAASPTHGFIVCNQSGERVASAESFESALVLLRALPIASEVIRASDGECLAIKARPRFYTSTRGAA